MKIIGLEQGTQEWLLWRSQGITATDAVVLSGRSPYKTIWRVWAEKTGYVSPVDLSCNPLVRNGRETEPKARLALEKEFNDMLLPLCVESSVNPMFRASLDGITSSGSPVEVKCPSKTTYDEVLLLKEKSSAYKLYYPQVQHQMLVTGSRIGYLYFYRDDDNYIGFEIPLDKELLQIVLNAGIQLMQDVFGKNEPEKDPQRDLYIPSGDAASSWIYTAQRYRAINLEAESLKQRLKDIENEQSELSLSLQEQMGDYFHADYCGLKVTRYTARGRINFERYLKDKNAYVPSELEQYRSKGSIRCRVTVSHDSVMPREVVDQDVNKPLTTLPSWSGGFAF